MSTIMQGCSQACCFLLDVERSYSAVIEVAQRKELNADGTGPGLGGNLFYAGMLDEVGRGLVVAGNVAGAATLTASAASEAQKQSIRDGVVDFLVTSLDEALRILKNEIRKRETVAVCVAQAPETLEREMAERGVVPDLRREVIVERMLSGAASGTWVDWHVAAMQAQWLPRLDALAAECLPSEAAEARRWLRLAPRYLGRMAQGERMLRADTEFAGQFADGIRSRVESGEVAVPVTMRIRDAAGCIERQFVPAAAIAGR